MITDDFFRGAPLRQRLPKDVEDTREILSLEASRSNDGPTIAIKNQHTIKPLSINLDQITQVGKPDLMGSRGLLGAFVRIRLAGLPLWVGMGLLIKGNHLPDRRMPIAVAQRV
jgi:hypothetical protein